MSSVDTQRLLQLCKTQSVTLNWNLCILDSEVQTLWLNSKVSQFMLIVRRVDVCLERLPVFLICDATIFIGDIWTYINIDHKSSQQRTLDPIWSILNSTMVITCMLHIRKARVRHLDRSWHRNVMSALQLLMTSLVLCIKTYMVVLKFLNLNQSPHSMFILMKRCWRT